MLQRSRRTPGCAEAAGRLTPSRVESPRQPTSTGWFTRWSDFGAASFMPAGEAGALERLEVLAWGRLLGELLQRCADALESEQRPEG